jgi:hypothetical protein
MKYKNITDQDLIIPGYGEVKSGESIDLPEDFHNVNFAKVKEENKNKKD